jgi:8-oxo-dGTP pyrophosphatase MutT (NUDIX family)
MLAIWQLVGKMIYFLATPTLGQLVLRNSKRTRVIVFDESSSKVLMVRSWISDQSWKLPGGGSHRHETAKAAARRELKEETGVDVSEQDILHLFKQHESDLGVPFSVDYFFARCQEQPIRAQQVEIIEVKWMNFEEARHNFGVNVTEVIEKLK